MNLTQEELEFIDKIVIQMIPSLINGIGYEYIPKQSYDFALEVLKERRKIIEESTKLTN